MAAPYFPESDAIFAGVVALPLAERQRALDAACAGRPDLRRDVESLLEAHDAAGRFLDAHTVTDAADAPPDPVGLRLGVFTLTGCIGRGGMSDVYRAERSDGAFDQHVAVKIARLTLTEPEAVRRFRAERQILAFLQHPHIVTLIDGGTLPDGRPYLVTELVLGTPITAYCHDRALDLEPRLRLMRQVCQAVQYAHRHGIVHRDLKPANLLVDEAGVPKVLDFGVAKLLTPLPGVDGHTATAVVTGPLTPNYASPEQIRGLPVTTASDVYALGVLLFEIVAGQRPYETAGRPLDAVLELVVKTQPGRPSAVTGLAPAGDHVALPYDRRRLRGDLDAIVLKAMAKEPERRYASAEELSDDIARFLGGKVVVAREPSTGYVLRKLAARHKASVAVAGVAVVGVLASLGAAIWQGHRAELERVKAEHRFNEVRALANALIFDLHDAVVPLAGSTPVRKQIIERALGYLERLRAEAGADSALQHELARAYLRIGQVLGVPGSPNLGDREGAIVRLRQARDLVLPLASEPNAEPERLITTVHVARALSQATGSVGRRNEARSFSQEAVRVAEQLVARQPGPTSQEMLAIALFQAASTAEDAEALAAWQRVARAFDEVLAAQPNALPKMRNVALAEKYLGGWYDQHDREAEALPHYRRALSLDERRLAADPSNRQAQFDVAIDQANVAIVLRASGDLPGAIALFEQSLRTRRQLAASDPNDVLTASRVGAGAVRLADAYFAAGRFPQALETGHEAVRAYERSITGRTDIAGLTELARAHFQLGRVRDALGQPTAACASYREARARFRQTPASAADRESVLRSHADQRAAACESTSP